MYVCMYYVCMCVYMYVFIHLFMRGLKNHGQYLIPEEKVKKARGEFPFQAALITGM